MSDRFHSSTFPLRSPVIICDALLALTGAAALCQTRIHDMSEMKCGEVRLAGSRLDHDLHFFVPGSLLGVGVLDFYQKAAVLLFTGSPQSPRSKVGTIDSLRI